MQRRRVKRLPKDSWMDEFKDALPRKVKMNKLRPVGIPEASIQRQVEAYLSLKGLKFIHIPDAIYKLCAPYSKTPIHIKKIISQSLKGLPDLLIFKRKTYQIGDDKLATKDIDTSCLLLELKKKNAKARQSQRKWHGNLPVQVVDNVAEAIKIIEKWSEI